ncbi:hypothetical protein PUR71_11300 [Streptomyces sp. SP17BM10]|uniref:hypothetical protein n=1 Tax=Streptomyces sp. SP17BM10 TaxID=3002530 RepID=UPI002E79F80B|nr:hypothetical protein [Streptomyces sp. SP17BM10]MEE1783488.1 hypothetical protein [Streptomyces sp. SP17BM10]
MLRRLAVAVAVCGAVAGSSGSAGPVDRPGAGSGAVVVIQENPDPAAPGELTTVHGIIANETPGYAPELVVTVTVQPGATPEGRYFPRSCKAAGQTVTCTFPAGLPSERTATALVPVRIAADYPGPAVGGTVTVTSPGDPSVDDSEDFVIEVVR